ncbi:MAG: Asp-tRNA(Asn)/Glu-tRNA(Gln) amidotransferase subunit GatB [Candidatus Acidiferrales bacterium]
MSRTAEDTRIAPNVLARYEAVIGLEVHVQLSTVTKVFCACRASFGDPPNTNVCPVCLGLPGALPVLNRGAVEKAIRAALALHCTVRETSRFARKNYFYPDLPKGYQISMYELSLATGGWLEIEHDGAAKRIGITRLHMEDDAAKALHEGFADSGEKTYIDFNRCGVPLIEIVSEPDMRAPAEAHAYLTALKQTLEYTGVSDCDMEKGSLRCDANVSVRPLGAKEFGTKAEVKNLNSFRYVQRALEHEIERHIAVIESGGRIAQETRLWNVAEGRTQPMRSKEFAHDYRYFPEPDLLPLRVSEAWKAEILAAMPELPEAKRRRFLRDYGVSEYDAGVLAVTRLLADYFEATVKAGAPGKSAANWIQTELLRRLNDTGREITASPVAPSALAELIGLIDSGKITGASAKKVFAQMFDTGRAAPEIVKAEGLAQVSDTAEIERVCRNVIAANPDNVAKFRSGNEGVFKFFVGQVMKATRGQANPQLVNEILRRLLAS